MVDFESDKGYDKDEYENLSGEYDFDGYYVLKNGDYFDN